jgi:CheY-like chemotaxis protein
MLLSVACQIALLEKLSVMTNKPFILIAEDDHDDFIILQEAFEEVKTPVDTLRLENGVLVLEYLDKIVESTGFPHLIILDMNLPKLRGVETLALLKARERYHNIPVIIHTTVIHEEEKQKCLQAGATAILQKPVFFEKLISQVKFFIALCRDKAFTTGMESLQ